MGSTSCRTAARGNARFTGSLIETWLAGGIEVVGMSDREGHDERELDDEREADPADYDCPGFIPGGQGA